MVVQEALAIMVVVAAAVVAVVGSSIEAGAALQAVGVVITAVGAAAMAQL